MQHQEWTLEIDHDNFQGKAFAEARGQPSRWVADMFEMQIMVNSAHKIFVWKDRYDNGDDDDDGILH
eukprot:3711624-Karenia_brevis.AAC.1